MVTRMERAALHVTMIVFVDMQLGPVYLSTLSRVILVDYDG